MSTRYLSNLALTIAAGFLVVATQAFTLSTVKWLTFALAIGTFVISLFMLVSGPNVIQRAVGGVAAVVSAWTIVASLIFTLATVTNLGFAAALALVGLGLIGLTAHELTTERVVHSLQVEREPVSGNGAAASRGPVAA
jgi:hypothetical protein